MSFDYKGHFQYQVKDVDRKLRRLTGAFTRYNVIDSDGDIGVKGMFTKTWSENRHRIKYLLNHDITKPIGKIDRLWDDDEYAYYEATVGNHTLGEDVLKMAEDGLLTEHSYGYEVVKDEQTKEALRLLEVKHWEVSLLTAWGANEFTPLLGISKSMNAEERAARLQARQKQLESFCRNSTATDETIELLLLEIKQIHNSISQSATSTPAVEQTPEPQTGDDELLLETTFKTALFKLETA